MEKRLSTNIDRYAQKIRKRVKGHKYLSLSFKIKTLKNTRDKTVTGRVIKYLKTYATIKSNKLSRHIKKFVIQKQK